MLTREVTWGEALVVELFKTEGGLKAAVNKIADLMGKSVGTRNTFAKLMRADDPSALNEKDQWRAWLLLTALGLDADDWGIPNDIVPGYYSTDLPDLRRRLLLPRMDSNHQPSDSWLLSGAA